MENEAQSLHLVGQLLREAVLGLKEVLRAQQAFRDRYGIDTRDKPEGRSPLDQATDEYLLEAAHRARTARARRRHAAARPASAVPASTAAAVDPALRSALVQFMAHLSPASIEARVAARGGTADAGGELGALPDVYMNLLQATGQELPHLFTEALAQAFAREADNRSIETFKPARE